MSTADQPIHFLDSGDIQIRLGGKPPPAPLVLPRPTFGQIKRLVKARAIHADTWLAIQNDAEAAKQAYLEAYPEGLPVTNDNLPALATLRDNVRATADAAEAAMDALAQAWWTEVFTVLNDGAVPEPDNWPSVFLDASLPAQMESHWRFVPSGPG